MRKEIRAVLALSEKNDEVSAHIQGRMIGGISGKALEELSPEYGQYYFVVNDLGFTGRIRFAVEADLNAYVSDIASFIATEYPSGNPGLTITAIHDDLTEERVL